MSNTLILGDGPGGLSAALLLAKCGHAVTVVGNDQTPLHVTDLRNYLGVEPTPGPEFLARARAQVTGFGATLVAGEVKTVEELDDDADSDARFVATLDDGTTYRGRYLIIASGRARQFGLALGVATNDEDGLDADHDGCTNLDGVYAVGWASRPHRIQAIISAGDGAAAALHVLSQEAGKNVRDFDTLPKD
ncbi:MAG: FAD-dependent oxidoreductase [Acidobacteriota bacterium]